MGNLDFTHHAAFAWYCLFLMASGIAMLAVAVLRYQIPRRRIIRALFGIGFFGYGFYLAFIFSGGHYFVFYYAFVVPILLISETIRSRRARQMLAQPASPVGASPSTGAGDPGMPTGYS
jgi:hypothetical protein